MYGEVDMLQDRAFWVGAACGAIAIAALIGPIAEILRSVFAPDSRIAKLEERLAQLGNNIQAPQAELIRQIETLRDRLDTELASAGTCQRRVADLEFRHEAKNNPGSQLGEACLRELDMVKGLKLKEAEAARLVGGRLYIGLEDAWTQSTAGCKVNFSTDLEPGKRTQSLAVGESIDVKTSVGTFRVISTAVPDGVTCVFDVVRPR
jgi:hypothetical protein